MQKNNTFLFLGIFSVVIVGVLVSFLYFYQNKLLPTGGSSAPRASRNSDVAAAETIADSQGIVGVDMLQQLIAEGEPSSNIIISPASINLALYLAANGASGKTLEEFQNTLVFKNRSLDQVNQESKQILNNLEKSESGLQVSIANSIWHKPAIHMLPNYVAKMQQFFNATVKETALGTPAGATEVNNWVSEKTKGKIPTILDSKDNSDTVLINAVYFNGDWTTQFNEKNTAPRDFHISGIKQISHPFMKLYDDFPYMENNEMQAISLPYGKDQTFDMVLILPKDSNKFTKGLSWEKLKKTMADLKTKKGTILMPKFKIEKDFVLNDSLQSLGLKAAFSNTADFSQMSQEPMKIDEVIHKVYIDVAEKGTEAAAVTAVKMVALSVALNPPKTFTMELNKPFFFIIRHKDSNTPLFMGMINEPKI